MITDAEAMEILNDTDSDDTRQNQEKVEWERLLDYVSVNIMGYPKDSRLPEPFINSIRKTVAALKLQKDGFSCLDLIILLRNCKESIEYCFHTMPFQSELHRLNTALKIAKNKYIDSVIEREQRELEVASVKGFVIPLCEDDTELKEQFKQKCDFDKRKSSQIISSLIAAWMDGKIRIAGI